MARRTFVGCSARLCISASTLRTGAAQDGRTRTSRPDRSSSATSGSRLERQAHSGEGELAHRVLVGRRGPGLQGHPDAASARRRQHVAAVVPARQGDEVVPGERHRRGRRPAPRQVRRRRADPELPVGQVMPQQPRAGDGSADRDREVDAVADHIRRLLGHGDAQPQRGMRGQQRRQRGGQAPRGAIPNTRKAGTTAAATRSCAACRPPTPVAAPPSPRFIPGGIPGARPTSTSR